MSSRVTRRGRTPEERRAGPESEAREAEGAASTGGAPDPAGAGEEDPTGRPARGLRIRPGEATRIDRGGGPSEDFGAGLLEADSGGAARSEPAGDGPEEPAGEGLSSDVSEDEAEAGEAAGGPAGEAEAGEETSARSPERGTPRRGAGAPTAARDAPETTEMSESEGRQAGPAASGDAPRAGEGRAGGSEPAFGEGLDVDPSERGAPPPESSPAEEGSERRASAAPSRRRGGGRTWPPGVGDEEPFGAALVSEPLSGSAGGAEGPGKRRSPGTEGNGRRAGPDSGGSETGMESGPEESGTASVGSGTGAGEASETGAGEASETGREDDRVGEEDDDAEGGGRPAGLRRPRLRASRTLRRRRGRGREPESAGVETAEEASTAETSAEEVPAEEEPAEGSERGTSGQAAPPRQESQATGRGHSGRRRGRRDEGRKAPRGGEEPGGAFGSGLEDTEGETAGTRRRSRSAEESRESSEERRERGRERARGRRGRRRSRGEPAEARSEAGRSGAPPAEDSAGGPDVEEGETAAPAREDTGTRRRRRPRRGRGRGSREEGEAAEAPPRRRRRGSEPGTGSRQALGEEAAPETEPEAGAETVGDETDDARREMAAERLAEETQARGRPEEPEAKPAKRPRARKTGRGDETTGGAPARARARPDVRRKILINAQDEEELRIGVLANGELEDLYYERAAEKKYLGNIYKGRVVNLEPGIQAAFVDLGIGRNGFLHVSDVLPAYKDATSIPVDGLSRRPEGWKNLKIQDILRKGQEVLVQIAKDSIGAKGPSLTTYVSIPGKYLVLMPGVSRHGVSKRIQNGRERATLRSKLANLEPAPGVGYIVRTAGQDKSQEELAKDFEELMEVWGEVRQGVKVRRAPCLLWAESDLVIRAVRDWLQADVDEILIDEAGSYERAREFCDKVMPQAVEKIKRWTGSTPLFSKFGVEEAIEQIYNRRFPLPSGGHIVIEPTEALVAIDVNSGKYRDEKDLEATALKTNLEAAEAIARQVRLRDLGGVIIIDFIDMEVAANRRKVEKALRDAMRDDRAKVWFTRISRFGIVELTRQRVRPSFERAHHETCKVCGGTGVVKAPRSTGFSVLRQVREALAKRRRGTLEVLAHADVVEYLANERRRALLELEERYGKSIVVQVQPDFRPEQFQVRYR